VLMWAKAEMLDSLAGVLWSTEEEGVASSWRSQGQLIQGEDLTTGSQDTGAGSGGEAEGSNAEFWDSQKAVVVSHGSNHNDSLVVGLLGCVGDNSREGNGWPVDAGHKQTAENDLVEGRLGAAYIDHVSQILLDTINTNVTYGPRTGKA
jgi:hypothetical protein